MSLYKISGAVERAVTCRVGCYQVRHSARPPAVPSFRYVLLPYPQAARRLSPPRAGHDDGPRTIRRSAPGRPSGSSPRSMPTRVPHHTHGSRGDLQTRPPGPGPPVSLNGRRVPWPSLGRGFIPRSLKDPGCFPYPH